MGKNCISFCKNREKRPERKWIPLLYEIQVFPWESCFSTTLPPTTSQYFLQTKSRRDEIYQLAIQPD